MSDMQPFGHGFQASQFNDLCSLHGRDLQVASRMVVSIIGEQSDKPQLPIALTGSPDGGIVTLQLGGEVFSPLPGGDFQDNSGTPNLIPGQRITASDPFQLREVGRKDRQHLGLASPHVYCSRVEEGRPCQHSRRFEFSATFRAGDTRAGLIKDGRRRDCQGSQPLDCQLDDVARLEPATDGLGRELEDAA